MLDRWVLRRPFEGAAAVRYANEARPAFAGLDDRVVAAMAGDLAGARVLLDVGAGRGELAAAAARAHPGLTAVCLEPSGVFGGAAGVRARAEAIPLRDASADVAVCVSSLRHVADRRAALRELRRVVRPGGAVWIVEVDRGAGAERVRRHLRAIRSWRVRAAVRLAVLAVCPPPAHFREEARAAGWRPGAVVPDPEQPFFLLRLS